MHSTPANLLSTDNLTQTHAMPIVPINEKTLSKLSKSSTLSALFMSLIQRFILKSSLLLLSFFAMLIIALNIPTIQLALGKALSHYAGTSGLTVFFAFSRYIQRDLSGANDALNEDFFSDKTLESLALNLNRTQSIKPSRENIKVIQFFARKYHLAPSELEKYIYHAEIAAKNKGLDVTLLLAVMSIESNMNPIVESPVGAQGLMQVLTSVHSDKLIALGGIKRVFEPDVNISVGATILADCIKLGGSIEMGLKCYVGATGPTDNGYGAKVLAEKDRIEKARLGIFDFANNSRPNSPTPLAIETNTSNPMTIGLITPDRAPELFNDRWDFEAEKNTVSAYPLLTTPSPITPLTPPNLPPAPSSAPTHIPTAAHPK